MALLGLGGEEIRPKIVAGDLPVILKEEMSELR